MSLSGISDQSLQNRVRCALEEVRPALKADGGDVRLVKVENGLVYLRLLGACHSCPMSDSTLKEFVEERIRLYAPEIVQVIAM